MVGLVGFEPTTPALSRRCSNQLSYRPLACLLTADKRERFSALFKALSSRKEVIQPHLPIRLPCYDLAPVTSFTLGGSLRLPTLGTPGFHGLTGGVYKVRERIHRIIADIRLLAIPASCSRVADCNLN